VGWNLTGADSARRVALAGTCQARKSLLEAAAASKPDQATVSHAPLRCSGAL
jgi:hypothetical protein